jgi:ABC-2 type transport system ATP-binding protein
MSQQYVVETVALSRTFRRHDAEEIVALDSVDFAVRTGEVHGLLGPNGAGKTTLCKVLSTALLPTRGVAYVGGHDVVRDTQRVRRLIGVAFGGERGLYWRLTGRQNVRYWATLHGLRRQEAKRRTQRVLERVGLAEHADRAVETYSRGMKQRLHLARSLVSQPLVLFLDEPSMGMDPVAALAFRDLVGELKREGCSLLITTHDMAEAAAICDRVSLIDNGRLRTTQDPRTIGRWFGGHERVKTSGASEEALRALKSHPGVESVVGEVSDELTVYLREPAATNDILRLLAADGVTDLRTHQPSLEEVYLKVVGERGLNVS